MRSVMENQVPCKDDALGFQHRLPKKRPVVDAYQVIEPNSMLQKEPAPHQPAPRGRADLGKHAAAMAAVRNPVEQEGRNSLQPVVHRLDGLPRLIIIVCRPAAKHVRFVSAGLFPYLSQPALMRKYMKISCIFP